MSSKTDPISIEFDGSKILTTVTSSESEVDLWLSEAKRLYDRWWRDLYVGFRTECNSDPNSDSIAIIQLCAGARCLVFRRSKASRIPKSLSDFIANPRIRLVGEHVHAHAQKLTAKGFSVTPKCKEISGGGGATSSEADRHWDDAEDLSYDQVKCAAVNVFGPYKNFRRPSWSWRWLRKCCGGELRVM